MQNILYARNDHPGIMLVCPHCRMGSRYDYGFVEEAIHNYNNIACVACGGNFGVIISVPDRAAEQRDEPDARGQVCPLCKGSRVRKYESRWSKCRRCHGTGQV